MSIEQSLNSFRRPEIAHRAEIMAGGVAIASVLLLGLRAFSQRSSGKDVILPIAESNFAYLVLGVMARSLVQRHQSRSQMAVLAGLVTIVEGARRRRA